jgi:hypothetical protein
VPPDRSARVCEAFAARDLAAAVVGRVDPGHQLVLRAGRDQLPLWDQQRAPLTGFGPREEAAS